MHLNRVLLAVKAEEEVHSGPVPSGATLCDSPYSLAAGRYILYISYACPWAARCLATLYLKGLEDVVGLSVVHPVWARHAHAALCGRRGVMAYLRCPVNAYWKNVFCCGGASLSSLP